ncbi:uncharacterized protein RHOBADRAFT_37097 [Rhodotorula graminis WP1]|uniref:Cation efflux protein transmembrane domain-containing protein n=1 Tax=Rhodotorula graminis (strain WP1) TaxID=578459 RepID=A0A194S3Z5_RHOGW|nr:uncharacterized protein RHOBADRAFT_37097 [Rhodotorula graminis WP1]KPV74136.1 hypothetical protein RHOBADRAFT_37097 [Rhodotorula graminis WP1]
MASSPTPTPTLRQRTPATTRSHSGHSHGAHSHSHGGLDETAHLSSAFTSLRNPSQLDPGSRITLVGLVANVGLTVVKGVAGYVLASSALLADAAHSGSDLVADVVTLVSYRIGRWAPSHRYPYGYGKFESLGSLVVSFLLFATAAGIGASLSLFSLGPRRLPSDSATDTATAPTTASHSHGDAASLEAAGAIVDARAMYFAAASIVVKEWLYRSTLRVARTQHSNVLLANAYHHRSDALGSLVALLAIGAARVGFPMLDPVGGLVVAGMIAKQGWDVGKDALGALVDQVADDEVQPKVYEAIRALSSAHVEPWRAAGDVDAAQGVANEDKTSLASASSAAGALSPSSPSSPSSSTTGTHPILAIPSVRIFASGPSLLIDVLVVLPSHLSLADANAVERAVRERVRDVVGRERVREVVVRLRADGESGEAAVELAHEHEHEHAHEEREGKGGKAQ